MEENQSMALKPQTMTQGPIGRQIIIFSLPLLGSSLIQQLYNTVDLIFVGSLLVFCALGIFIGLSVGTGVVTARYLGAGKLNRVRKGTRVCLAIGVITAVSLSGSVLLMGEHLFALFTNSKAVVAIGLELAKVTFPFYFIYVFLEIFASVVRGAGKAIPPMIIILVTLCGLRLILVNVFMHL